MSWHLGSLDGQIVLDLPNVSEDGKIAGKLHVELAECRKFDVSGRLEKAGADQGRIASSFALSGRDHFLEGGGEYVVAAGTSVGPAAWPRIVGIAATIGDGSSGLPATIHHALLPMMNRDPSVLKAAYEESYMVLEISVQDDDFPSCTGIWQGTVNKDGKTSPLGPDYRGRKRSTDPKRLKAVCTPDGSDGSFINIPAFIPLVPGRAPVMVQFVGPTHHFLDPPLKDAHEQIEKCFDDPVHLVENHQTLVLQYENDTRSPRETKKINFNDHHLEMTHSNIIIKPQ